MWLFPLNLKVYKDLKTEIYGIYFDNKLITAFCQVKPHKYSLAHLGSYFHIQHLTDVKKSTEHNFQCFK